MDKITICWIIEYACIHKQDEIIDCYFDDMLDIMNNPDYSNNLSVYNAAGRFIIRILQTNLYESSNPSLRKELDLLTYLLNEYGCPGSKEDALSLVVDMERQCYMHYIRQFDKDISPKIADKKRIYRELKKFHKSMKEKHNLRKTNKSESPEQDVIDICDAILPKEKEVIEDIDKFLSKVNPNNRRIYSYIDKYINKYPFEPFQEDLCKFLEDIDKKLPESVLTYFTEIWNQRKKYTENGITRKEISDIFKKNVPLNSVHQLKDPDVIQFIKDNNLYDYYNITSHSPINNNQQTIIQDDTESQTHSQTHSQLYTQNITQDDIHDDTRSETQNEDFNISNQTQIPITNESVLAWDSDESLNDLLENSNKEISQQNVNVTPININRNNQETYKTPIVATELRESIHNLVELRGTDPIHKASIESRNAQKRKELENRENPPPPKKRKIIKKSPIECQLAWDSESEEEMDIEPISYREPQRITSLSPIHTPNQGNITPIKTKRRRWTDEEVTKLIEGIALFGEGNWKSIVKHFNFTNRTGVQLKDKYRNLLKKFTKEEILENGKNATVHNLRVRFV